jgi:hypothetical protein
MKKLVFIAISIFTITIIGCKEEKSDPKIVLSAFFEAMSKKNLEAARELSTEDSKSTIDLIDLQMKMSLDTIEKMKFDKADLQLGTAKIDDNQATIPVIIKNIDTLDFVMKKEKGNWKVAFDFATIMKMSMNMLQKKGFNSKNIDQLKDIENINTDSLKKNINDHLKELDSIKKLLKNQDI